MNATIEYITNSLRNCMYADAKVFSAWRKSNGALYGGYTFNDPFGSTSARFFVIVNRYVHTFPTMKKAKAWMAANL